MRKGCARYALWGALLCGVLILSGCERKTIQEIRAEPFLYANREVAIAGNVIRSFSMLGRGAYEIEDGTGRLWVLSETGVPREGSRILVRGIVRDAYNVSSFVKLPEPVSSGLVLFESSHKARQHL